MNDNFVRFWCWSGPLIDSKRLLDASHDDGSVRFVVYGHVLEHVSCMDEGYRVMCLEDGRLYRDIVLQRVVMSDLIAHSIPLAYL